MSEENTETQAAAPKMKKKVSGVVATASLVVLATENKKRGASAERFQHYLDDNPTTVQEALDAGLTMGDIHYDIIHGSIEVEGAEISEYMPTPRGTKKKDDSGEEEENDSEEDTETADSEMF